MSGRKVFSSTLLGSVVGGLHINLTEATSVREKMDLITYMWGFTEKRGSRGQSGFGAYANPRRGRGGEESTYWKTKDFLKR